MISRRRWCGRTGAWSRWLLVALLLALLLLNLVAAAHAWRFTHPQVAAEATPRPEQLSWVGKLRTLVTGVAFKRASAAVDPGSSAAHWSEFTVDDGLGGRTPVWRLIPKRTPKRTPEGTVERAPQPPPGTALLVHGYGGERSRMLAIARYYLQRGLQVLLPDLPGHGASPHAWTSLGAKEAAVVAAVAAHRDWPRPMILHGRSLGAVSVIGALADGANADAAVLEAPYASLSDTVCRRFELMGLPCFPFTPLLLAWGGVFTGSNPFAGQPGDRIATLDTPLLLMVGTQDRRVPPAQVAALAAAAGGRSAWVPVPGVGHGDLQSADPQRYARVLDGFLGLSREP